MVRLLIAAAVLCLTGCSTHDSVSAQGSRSRANVAPGSLHEQAILDALNRLRTDPETFALMIDSRRAYFQGKILRLPAHAAVETREGEPAVEEAADALAGSDPVPPLQLAPALRLAAREHGKDLGKRGLISHEGPDGSSPRDRILRYCGVEGETGELISFGLDEPEEIIVELAVDDGVASRAHRRILMNPDFRYAAVACGPHSFYKTVCVIDLAHSVGPKTAR